MLFQHLARSLSRMRVLVVGTYRDTDITRQSALSETLVALNREGGIERVLLRGLTRDEVGSYIEAVANLTPPSTVVDRVHEETEGNPFFLSEVVNLMTEEGTLDAATSREVSLPDGVREALGRRLDRLTDDANELLQIAAVAGREFRLDTLSALGDNTDDELLMLLEEGLGARVIEETDAAGQYRFTHALMQETLLGELSTTRRVRTHGRIGEALEQRWGQERSDERATRLASHFVEAATLTDHHAEKAMHYSRLAAQQAESQAGWGEAARHYEDCLALIEDTDTALAADEAALCLAAGICHRNDFVARDAWRRLLRAMDLYRARGEGAGMARAALAANLVPAPDERVARLLEEALEALGGGEPHLEALLHARLALRLGSEADAARHRTRADALAAEHGFVDVRAALLQQEAMASRDASAFADSARLFTEAQRLFDSASLAVEAGEAYRWAMASMTLSGRPAEARELAERGIDYARSHHLPMDESVIAGFLTGLLFGLCEFDQVDVLLDKYEDEGDAAYYFSAIRADRALLAGDPASAQATLLPYENVGGVSNSRNHARTARFLLMLDERDAALAAFEQARESMARNSDAQDVDGFRLSRVPLLGLDTAGIDLADEPFLRAWFSFLQTQGALSHITTIGNSEQVIYGFLALALGEDETAESAFTNNLEWAAREGADIISGRCHQGLAEVCVLRGDTAGATAHLDAAMKLFEQHGAKLYLDQVIARKLELQGVSPADAGPGAATIVAETPALDDTIPAE